MGRVLVLFRGFGFVFYKQKTASDRKYGLVGSEMWMRDSLGPPSPGYGGDADDAKPVAEEVMAAISAVGD